ncbi:hypothetical protein BT67DRAFT_273809 [Trichocladium antarcticum]|uniref:Uncharacterized protein n=1 Tax=Trichocladium antarcticum TaxID=1450529 RepID=A0AAN6ULP9_9PEZI|nr:hypothetical protein BT67DRAFT_273809 [Trichocladium antarcticum]
MVWAGAVFRVLARMKKTRKWEGPNLTTTTLAWIPSQSGVLTVGRCCPVSHRREALSHPSIPHISTSIRGTVLVGDLDELLRQTPRAQPKTPRTRAGSDRHGNTVFHAAKGGEGSEFVCSPS